MMPPDDPSQPAPRGRAVQASSVQSDAFRCRRCDCEVTLERRADGDFCPQCGWEKAAAERFEAKYPRGTRRRKKVDRAADEFRLAENGFSIKGQHYPYADIVQVQSLVEKRTASFGGLSLDAGHAESIVVTLKENRIVRIAGLGPGASSALKAPTGAAFDGGLERVRKTLLERSFPGRLRHFRTLIEGSSGIRLGVLEFSRDGVRQGRTFYPYAQVDLHYVPDLLGVTLRMARGGRVTVKQLFNDLKSNGDVILPLLMASYGVRIGH